MPTKPVQDLDTKMKSRTMLLQDRIEMSYQWPENPPGIECGLDMIDLYLGGLQRGQLHLLCAPEGISATSLLLSLSLHATRQAGVLFVTAGTASAICSRLVDNYAGIEDREMATPTELQNAMNGLGRWMRYPFRVLENEQDSAMDLVLMLQAELYRNRADESPLGLVVVDLSEGDGSKVSLGRDELTVLHQIAREADVAILALSQLPAIEFPVTVSKVQLDDELEGVFAYQAEPWWHHTDAMIPGAPEGIEQVLDILMLLQWSVDQRSGAPHEDRRILQVLRQRDRYHHFIQLHHSPASGEYWEDEEHRYHSSCGSNVSVPEKG